MQALVYIDNELKYVYTCMCKHAYKNINYSTLGGNAAGKDVLHLVIQEICSLHLENIAGNIRYYILNGKD